MRNASDIPARWIVFTWYAPMVVFLYLFIDLFDPNKNYHFIWIVALICFFSLFARAIHPLLYDLPLFILYVFSVVSELQLEFHNKLGVALIVFSVLFFVYLFRISIPGYLPKNR